MNRYFLSILITLLAATQANAQESYADRVKRYIDTYYPLAMAEQKSAGIPACITLGQGILETEAGNSELVTGANNHFGIKCRNGWKGETFTHNDDLPNECFKKYSTAAESYRDHSEHLKKNPRYAPLFSLSKTDYAGWAVTLKKCGYATNPQYARRLIKIIEDFQLQEYTYSALDSSVLNNQVAPPEPAARPVATTTTTTTSTLPATGGSTETTSAASTSGGLQATTTATLTPTTTTTVTTTTTTTGPTTETTTTEEDEQVVVPPMISVDSSKLVTVNGMKAFYAMKDEQLLPYAIRYRVRYARLLEMNDLPDGPMPFNSYVYLEKKLTSGINTTHMVENGESLLQISQLEGIQLRKLMALNLLGPNEEPLPGSTLELQKMATTKPEVAIMERPAHVGNAISTDPAADPRTGSNYLTIKRTKGKPADADKKGTAKATASTNNAPAVKTTEAPATTSTAKTAPGATTEPVEDTTDADDLASLKANLDKVVYAEDGTPVPAAASEYYVVGKGETASQIARKHRITITQIIQWNNVAPDRIKAGQRLRIAPPGGSEVAATTTQATTTAPAAPTVAPETAPKTTVSAATTNGTYVVQKGETVSAIARKNNITIKQLLEWNGIEADKIRAGQTLKVAGDAAPVAPANAATASTDDKFYVIQKGETASAIARKHGISVKQLLQWNNIEADKIQQGKKLRVKE